MLMIQLTGLSGAGKTTLANQAKIDLEQYGYPVEVLDGDEYRRELWPELTFSPADRHESIRRLAWVGQRLCSRGIIVIMAAINPYESVRAGLSATYANVKTVYIHCDLPVLIQRDTKGLYARALLPNDHPDKLPNLTGLNAPYEIPCAPDLRIDTTSQPVAEATAKLVAFVLASLTATQPATTPNRPESFAD